MYGIGKEYDVDHGRKGKFRIRVTEVNGSHVVGVITLGEARYTSESNKVEGDYIGLSTDRPFIKLTPVK